jgi:hypothetical protein
LQYTVENLIAEGDKVVVRWRWNATHKGEFLGIPATGKEAPMTGIAIYRVTRGRIVERWVEVGLLTSCARACLQTRLFVLMTARLKAIFHKTGELPDRIMVSRVVCKHALVMNRDTMTSKMRWILQKLAFLDMCFADSAW